MEGGLFLWQSLYVKDKLERFKQYLPAKGPKFNGAETPMDNNIRLHKKVATQLHFKQKEIEVEAVSVDRSSKRNWCRVYGGSNSYIGGILATIPTGGDGTERVYYDCIKGWQQVLH